MLSLSDIELSIICINGKEEAFLCWVYILFLILFFSFFPHRTLGNELRTVRTGKGCGGVLISVTSCF